MNLTPKIIFEDEDLLVLNKPSGMTVNNAETTRGQETLQDWIGNYFSGKEIFGNSEHDFDKRNGIVHRLDKETSGVILIAKNIAAFEDLQAQFKDRTVKKTYQALAHGRLSPREGEIKVPVGRLGWNRKQFGIVAGGKPAVTFYETVRVYEHDRDELSLLTLFPKTGRTHQIRVHLKYLNRPIFADFLYAGRKTARKDRRFLPRVFLHAFSISFTHPRTENEVAFRAELAGDLQGFLDSLKILEDAKE